MRPSLRSASQSQPSTASGGSSSVPYHSAASRRLAKARAPSSSRSSQASSRESTPALSEPFLSSQDYLPADGESGTIGAQFDIRWDDIWKDGKKLSQHRIGYRVVNKSQLAGKVARSKMWDYGADLVFRTLRASTDAFGSVSAAICQKEETLQSTTLRRTTLELTWREFTRFLLSLVTCLILSAHQILLKLLEKLQAQTTRLPTWCGRKRSCRWRILTGLSP